MSCSFRVSVTITATMIVWWLLSNLERSSLTLSRSLALVRVMKVVKFLLSGFSQVTSQQRTDLPYSSQVVITLAKP